MTLAEAQTQLAAWEAASLALATGRSYSIGDRQLTRNDAGEVREMMTFFQRKVDALTASGAGSNKRASIATWNDV